MIKKFKEFINEEQSPAPFINWNEIGERIIKKFSKIYPDLTIEWRASEKAFYVEGQYTGFIDVPLGGAQMSDEEIINQIENTLRDKEYIVKYEEGEFELEDGDRIRLNKNKF